MSKLDDEIYKPRRSAAYIPPYWEICKICKIPFKTDLFAKTCERCSVLLDENSFISFITFEGIFIYYCIYRNFFLLDFVYN